MTLLIKNIIYETIAKEIYTKSKTNNNDIQASVITIICNN